MQYMISYTRNFKSDQNTSETLEALKDVDQVPVVFKTQLIKSDFLSQSCDKNNRHLISKKHEAISTLSK